MFLVFLTLIFLPSITFAAAPTASYDLIAPIGTLSGSVTLSQYLEGIFQTVIGIAGVLAVLMLVICGIRLMGTGSVAGKSEAKQCIWNAIFGLLLAIGSWILLNTINPLLLKSDGTITVNSPAPIASPPPGPSTEPNPTAPGCYFKYKEISTGNTKFARFDACTTCDNVKQNFQDDPTKYTVLSSCYKIQGSAGATPTNPGPVSTTPPPPTSAPVSGVSGSVTCKGSPPNICEGQIHQCTTNTCAQFKGWASSYASGGVTANLLMAIIFQESTCGQRLYSPAGACGPTQFKPASANPYKAACGVTENVTCDWLASKANWEKDVCMTSKYLQAIASSACGSSVGQMAAGYNAGSGAASCGASANCASDTSCFGGSVKKWECNWSDNAHQTCDSGYKETRNYAARIIYCTTNPPAY